MKLVQKTGSKPESTNSLRTKQFGLFECPVCLEHVERPLSHGRRNKSCGKRECRKATLQWSPPKVKSLIRPIQINQKEVSRNKLRFYDAFRLWYKRVDKSRLCPTIKTLEDAADAFYVEYEAFKLQYPTQRVTIALHDIEGLISKANTYFTLSSKSEGLSTLERQVTQLNKSTRVSKEKIKEFIKNDVLSDAEYEELFNKLIYEKYSHKKNTEHLYLVSAGPYTKIGVAKNPDKRLIAISTGCPFKPEIIVTKQFGKLCYLVERYLHILHADKCTNGEWFELTKEDIENIKNTPNEQLVKEAAMEIAKNKQKYVDSTRVYNDEGKLDKLRKEAEERYIQACENYEESKRQMREANKKPSIETVHEWDERFEHDRTNQIEACTTHGMSKTPLYKAWQTMKKIYKVCEEWQVFEPFKEVVEMEYSKYVEEDNARVYPLETGTIIGPDNYIIKPKAEHEVKSAVARAVQQLNKDGLVIGEYRTVTEAAKAVDGIASKISAVCKGTRKSHAGHNWRYKD